MSSGVGNPDAYHNAVSLAMTAVMIGGVDLEDTERFFRSCGVHKNDWREWYARMSISRDSALCGQPEWRERKRALAEKYPDLVSIDEDE